jgi:hypothetical protein
MNVKPFALASVGAITLVGSASADVIWDQRWDGLGRAVVAQMWPDFPDFDAFEFDDFSIPDGPGYFLTTLNVEGLEGGDPEFNEAIVAEIWDGLPGSFGGSIVMVSISGSEDPATGNLTFDFGGQPLLPGNYWITAYVVRPFIGGHWWWYRTNEGAPNRSEHFFWNPGGGYGFGSDPVPGTVVFDTPADMNFVLEGDVIPACPADIDGDGIVGFQDLVAVLAAWGNQGGPEDLNGDGLVGMQDVIALLAAWGPCES